MLGGCWVGAAWKKDAIIFRECGEWTLFASEKVEEKGHQRKRKMYVFIIDSFLIVLPLTFKMYNNN